MGVATCVAMGCFQAILCRFSLNSYLKSWTSRSLCKFHAYESTAFKVLVLPNTILFCLTTIIGNWSVLTTLISEIICIVAELVPTCGPVKIYHLWYVRPWRVESQPLIAPDQYLVHYPLELARFIKIVVKQNSIVFGSTRTLNAVDSHTWNKLQPLDIQLFRRLSRENQHTMACRKPIATYVVRPTPLRGHPALCVV